MITHNSFYIDGAWAAAHSAERLSVVNPTTEQPIGSVPLGDSVDIDRAVTAAHRAFEVWASIPPAERARHLHAIADAIAARTDEFASLITDEVGVPIDFCRAVQVGWTVQYFRDAANALSRLKFEEPYEDTAILRREAVGVVGAITPWNFPLMQSAAKIAPALAAGCTVVLKPSEVAPLNLYLLAEVAMETGLPKGVLNIVTGTGPIAGEALTRHPLVDALSFTGSTVAGTRVAANGAADVKRVTLELGGKSAALVLPGADLAHAVQATTADCFANSGQKCVAHTRLIVHRDQLAEAERIAVDTAHSMPVGDPHDPASAIGPLVSDVQLDRVRGHIAEAVESRAKLLTGGLERPAGLESGYYVRPTVFSEVTPDMAIAQNEVFGPVLAIMAYDTIDEAIQIANSSEYGLGGGVWAATREEGVEVARRIRTGQVAVNGAIPTASLPFGGFKKSGIGREGGPIAVEEFLEIKTIF